MPGGLHARLCHAFIFYIFCMSWLFNVWKCRWLSLYLPTSFDLLTRFDVRYFGIYYSDIKNIPVYSRERLWHSASLWAKFLLRPPQYGSRILWSAWSAYHSVCLSVCPQPYIPAATRPNVTKFLFTLPVAVDWSASRGIAVGSVLPVFLSIISFIDDIMFHIMDPMAACHYRISVLS